MRRGFPLRRLADFLRQVSLVAYSPLEKHFVDQTQEDLFFSKSNQLSTSSNVRELPKLDEEYSYPRAESARPPRRPNSFRFRILGRTPERSADASFATARARNERNGSYFPFCSDDDRARADILFQVHGARRRGLLRVFSAEKMQCKQQTEFFFWLLLEEEEEGRRRGGGGGGSALWEAACCSSATTEAPLVLVSFYCFLLVGWRN